MSLTNIKSKIQSERGFTIVELLIVVVVIAILAAITIVSYNGITRSANASSSKSQAATVAKKLEAYQAENGRYPINPGELNDSSKSFHLPASNYSTTASDAAFAVGGLTADNGKNTVIIRKCGTGTAPAPATQAAVTATNIVGMQVYIWDYEGTGSATGKLQATVGTTSGGTGANAVLCPAAQ